MTPSRSRSVSKEQTEDSVKRGRLVSTKSKSKSLRKSNSRSKSPKASHRRSNSRRRSISGKRSTSKRRSVSRRRSRSRERGRTGIKYRSRSRSPRRSPENDDGYRLHVGDLDEAIRKDDLERTFMKYGPLKEIWLASYAPYYAFVVFRDRMDAQDACEGADGTRVSGKRMRVSLAKPRHRGPRERFVPDSYRGDRDRNDRGYSRHSSRY